MRHSGLPLAIAGSHASTHTLPEHRRAQNADHLAHNTPFSAFFTKVVCDLGATPPQVAASPSPIGGIALHEPPTRRQKASCSAKPPRPPAWRAPEGPEGTGGCETRARLRRPWAAAGPGRTTSRRAERSSRRGRLAGGPPSTGAQSSPARNNSARAAAPVTGRCTRYGPLHPLRGAAPDQKGCTAYGSGVSHPITRTNAESARRPPTISQASSMIGPKATTATRLTTSGRVRIRRSPGSMHQAEATPGHPLTMVG